MLISEYKMKGVLIILVSNLLEILMVINYNCI